MSMTPKQKKNSRDLHEAIARLLLPKLKNRKQRRKFERRIQRMRDSI
jgi:hypothetical protein